MSKYAPLGDFLRTRQTNEVPMSFNEIEQVIGFALPDSSRNHAAWWSNNPSNNVMTKIWLSAGFQTERVDLGGRRLVFCRLSRSVAPLRSSGGTIRSVPAAPAERLGRHPLIGAMKGTFTVSRDLDLTQPADLEWGKVYE